MSIDEEFAARRLATARARFILAEAGTDPDEYTAAARARDQAETDYAEAVNS